MYILNGILKSDLLQHNIVSYIQYILTISVWLKDSPVRGLRLPKLCSIKI